MALAEAYASRVIGFDRSAKMLAQVRSRHHHLSFCLADAQAVPLRRASIGMVFLSNVVHHLTDLEQAADGFAYVLFPRGFVVVRNYVREQLQDVPYLEFFPEAYAASVQTTPFGSDREAAFGRAGFALLSYYTVEQPVAGSPIEYLSKVRSRVRTQISPQSPTRPSKLVSRASPRSSPMGRRRSRREQLGLFAFQKI
jgi:SAM-dependent methyltransferase